jgi:hypothetical protein
MARGYSVASDALATLIDGTPLDRVWEEFQATINLQNERRSALLSTLCAPVAVPAEAVAQGIGSDNFEDASEFGEPTGLRAVPTIVEQGFPFKWRDKASRFTSKALATMTSDQVAAVHNAVLEADNRQIFRAVLAALMFPTTIATRPTNENGTSIYSLYSGEADDTPPAYLNTTFSANHTHFFTTGSSAVDGIDLRDLMRKVTEHGFTTTDGSKLLVFCNPAEGEVIAGFRAGQGSPASPLDFIPSSGAPAFLTTETLIGDRPPATFGGLTVIGSFGSAWIVQDDYVPSGFVVAVATQGANSPFNPLAFREHIRPELRGLRLYAGSNNSYPLVDSFYQRGFGIAVRQRGAAAVLEVTASSTYTPPTLPVA